MYCPSCGNSVNNKLKFCNSCGERLGKADDDGGSSPGKMLENVVTALSVSVVFGFGILVGLVAVLLGSGVNTEAVVVIAIVYLAAVFGICFSLVRQVTKLIDARLKTSGYAQDEAPSMLQPRTTAQLDEYLQPVTSVTDHTTRTLDKVPFKQG